MTQMRTARFLFGASMAVIVLELFASALVLLLSCVCCVFSMLLCCVFQLIRKQSPPGASTDEVR